MPAKYRVEPYNRISLIEEDKKKRKKPGYTVSNNKKNEKHKVWYMKGCSNMPCRSRINLYTLRISANISMLLRPVPVAANLGAFPLLRDRVVPQKGWPGAHHGRSKV